MRRYLHEFPLAWPCLVNAPTPIEEQSAPAKKGNESQISDTKILFQDI